MKHNRNRLALSFVIVLAVVFPLNSQEGRESQDREALLFLSTSPINAAVYLDGTLLKERTPLLQRNILGQNHRIEIYKNGYESVEMGLEVEPGRIESLEIELKKTRFETTFPSEEAVVVGEMRAVNEEGVFSLPHGRYRFSIENDDLRVDPVYPGEAWITALNISTPLFFVLSGLLTVTDLIQPAESGFVLSPPTLSSYGLTLSSLGLNIAFRLRREAFKRSFAEKTIEAHRSSYKADRLYQKGQEMTAANRLDEALDYYSRIILHAKDSHLFPFALYQVAKIHFIKGEYELARQELELIVNRYPHPRLYDRALKTLADLEYRLKRYDQSLRSLDAMLFVDPIFSRREIEEYRKEILDASQGN